MTNEMTDHEQQEKRHRRFWVGLIFAMLGAQVLLMIVSVYLATSDQSFAIEPNYYQKSLKWDDFAAQQRDNARLGWKLEVELPARVDRSTPASLLCRLTDADGKPLDDATIDLVAFPQVRGSDRLSAVFVSLGDGRYQADVPFRHGGKWQFRFAVRHQENLFTDEQRLYVELEKERSS